MQEVDLFLNFIQPLNKYNISYAITGSMAAIVYGEPRLTHDIDLVVLLESKNIPDLKMAFPDNDFSIPLEETIITEIKREEKGHFNIIHFKTGFKADIYLTGKNELQLFAIENNISIKYKGIDISIAPIEYVIIKKLQFYEEGKSEKHIRDINSMIEISDNLINKELLDSLLDKYSLKSIYNKIRVA